MNDLQEAPVAEPAAHGGAPRARRRRRWLGWLLYPLAVIGLLAVALVAFAYYRHRNDAPAVPRVGIDEAAVIDSTMGDTYGKYSAAKKGWLYVGDDDITYLMRVVQQARIPDGADGDELYFVASGSAVDGRASAVYGAFHVFPSRPYDGNLSQTHTEIRYASTVPVRPEQVRFEALSETLWGWVIKTQHAGDETPPSVTITNTVLAPHDNQVVVLGEFLAAVDTDPGIPCDEAKARWDGYNRHDRPAVEDEDIDRIDEPLRCDKRRFAYRTATVNGAIPVPITVTAGGSRDGQPVEARTWKLMFNPKSFAYDIPEELQNR